MAAVWLASSSAAQQLWKSTSTSCTYMARPKNEITKVFGSEVFRLPSRKQGAEFGAAWMCSENLTKMWLEGYPLFTHLTTSVCKIKHAVVRSISYCKL